MRKLKVSSARMVEEARARIEEIEAEALIARLGDPRLVVVDLRDVRERRREGFIPGSVHVPRGMLEFWVDPESPYFLPIFGEEDREFVLHCAAGLRSALAAATLQDMGMEVAHLKEGFAAWKAQGGPVEVPEKR